MCWDNPATWWNICLGVDATLYFEQTPEGLKISVVRAQRIYNNHQWPNPLVVKLENVMPAMDLVQFKTTAATALSPGQMNFEMEIIDTGEASELKLGFEYRPLRSSLDKDFNIPWSSTDLMPVNATSGVYKLIVADELFKNPQNPDKKKGGGITNASVSISGVEYRAIVYQNNLKIEGNTMAIKK
ncbi:MAG: hypothetical protein MI921_19100 [Cytophagales bacterium]|nr:hypothetical protein [Cytophagales bacterium]